MYGRSIGDLSVFVAHEGTETPIFNISGKQGPFWQNTHRELPQNSPIQVRGTLWAIEYSLVFYRVLRVK